MTLRNGKVLLPAPSPGLTTILERGPTGSPEGQLLPVAMVAIALGCAELPRGHLIRRICFHLFVIIAWRGPCWIQCLPAQPLPPSPLSLLLAAVPACLYFSLQEGKP